MEQNSEWERSFPLSDFRGKNDTAGALVTLKTMRLKLYSVLLQARVRGCQKWDRVTDFGLWLKEGQGPRQPFIVPISAISMVMI